MNNDLRIKNEMVRMFKPSTVLVDTNDKGNKLLKSYRDEYLITTANGKYWAMIDLEDWDKVKNHYWAECDGGYLRTTIMVDGKPTWRRMHTLIMPNGHKGYVVDHENRTKSDNRKQNLVIKTLRENFLNSEYWDEKIAKKKEQDLMDRIREEIMNDSYWNEDEVI